MTRTHVVTKSDIDHWRAMIRSDVEGHYALSMGVALSQTDKASAWLEKARQHPRWQTAATLARRYVTDHHHDAAAETATIKANPDDAVEGLCQLGGICRGTASFPASQILNIYRHATEIAAESGSPQSQLWASMRYDEELCRQEKPDQVRNSLRVLDTVLTSPISDRSVLLQLYSLASQTQKAGQFEIAHAIDCHLVEMVAALDMEDASDADVVLNILSRVAAFSDADILEKLEGAALKICHANPQSGVKLINLVALTLDKGHLKFAHALLAGIQKGAIRVGLLAHIVLRSPKPAIYAKELMAAASSQNIIPERFKLVLAQALLAAGQTGAALSVSTGLSEATALLVQVTGLLTSGRMVEAREALDRLRNASPHPVQVQRAEAMLLLATNDPKGALDALKPGFASGQTGIFERMLAALAVIAQSPLEGRRLFADLVSEYPPALLIRAVNTFPLYREQILSGLGDEAAALLLV